MKLNNIYKLCKNCKKNNYDSNIYCLKCKDTKYCSHFCKNTDIHDEIICNKLKYNYLISNEIPNLLKNFNGFNVFYEPKYSMYYGYIIDINDSNILHQDLKKNDINWIKSMNKEEYAKLVYETNEYKNINIDKSNYTIYTYMDSERFAEACVKTIQLVDHIDGETDISHMSNLYILLYCMDIGIIYIVDYKK